MAEAHRAVQAGSARRARRALAALTALAALVVAGCSSTVRVPGPTRTATKTLVVEDPSYVFSTVTATATVTKQVAKPHVAATTRPAAPVNGFTYKISADSGSATNVTYMKDGDIVQDTNVSLPWSKTVDACGTLCIVSAQNAGSGRITCEIDGPDGVEDKSTSTGAYAVVNCQA